MTILVFLVDTSASMAQKNYQGISALDTAKTLIDQLIKTGWREGNQVLNDQLSGLRPCGRHPLKAGIISAFHFVNMNRATSGIDNYGHGRFPFFLEQVVVISISDANSVLDIPADFELRGNLRNAADIAAGRPLPPGIELTEELFRWDQRLFCITLRMGSQPSAAPPLRAPGQDKTIDIDHSPIQKMCASTGGRSYSIVSHRQLPALVEQLIQTIQPNGVTLKFDFATSFATNGHIEGSEEEKKAEIAAISLRKHLESRPLVMINVPRNKTGHWPVPEAFWPDHVQNGVLPPRKAHPFVVINSQPVEAQVNTEFPFDKYEIESGYLAEFVRERSAASPNICWQVFVPNSYRISGIGKSFGYLKLATNMTTVNLFIMPYNYPSLLKLLQEHKGDARLRNHPEWRRKLDKYMEEIPAYYLQGMKKALQRLKLLAVSEDPPQLVYLPPILNYLGKCKHVAKEEMDGRLMEIAARLREPPRAPSYSIPIEKRTIPVKERLNFRLNFQKKKEKEVEKKDPKSRKRLLPPLPQTKPLNPYEEEDIHQDPEASEAVAGASTIESHPILLDISDWCLSYRGSKRAVFAPETAFRNPFNIRRVHLIEMLPRLRVNLNQQLSSSTIPVLEGGHPGQICRLQNAYELHSLPQMTMGDYNLYTKELAAIGGAPLREVEEKLTREHTFGNPFKKDKKSMAIDEVGEAPPSASPTATSSSGLTRKDRRQLSEGGRPPRRKPGPLPINSLQLWREKRRTISSASSFASDAVASMEDLAEDLSTVQESENEKTSMDIEEMGPLRMADESFDEEEKEVQSGRPNETPLTKVPNGVINYTAWGMEEEADEEDDDVQILTEIDSNDNTPAVKKKKLNDGKAQGRSEEIKDRGILKHKKAHSSIWPNKELPQNGRNSKAVNSTEAAVSSGKSTTPERNFCLPRAISDKQTGETSCVQSSLSALSESEIWQNKINIAACIRRREKSSVIVAEIDSLLSSTPRSSRLMLYEYAHRESCRFKDPKLIEALRLKVATVASTTH